MFTSTDSTQDLYNELDKSWLASNPSMIIVIPLALVVAVVVAVMLIRRGSR